MSIFCVSWGRSFAFSFSSRFRSSSKSSKECLCGGENERGIEWFHSGLVRASLSMPNNGHSNWSSPASFWLFPWKILSDWCWAKPYEHSIGTSSFQVTQGKRFVHTHFNILSAAAAFFTSFSKRNIIEVVPFRFSSVWWSSILTNSFYGSDLNNYFLKQRIKGLFDASQQFEV